MDGHKRYTQYLLLKGKQVKREVRELEKYGGRDWVRKEGYDYNSI